MCIGLGYICLRGREIFYNKTCKVYNNTCSNSKFGIDCRMRMYDNLQYQSIVSFERIVSGRFSPLTAPLPLTRKVTRPPAPAPLTYALAQPHRHSHRSGHVYKTRDSAPHQPSTTTEHDVPHHEFTTLQRRKMKFTALRHADTLINLHNG